MIGAFKRGWLLLVLGMSSTFGCSEPSDEKQSPLPSNPENCLIGGISADSPELDAIGAMVAVNFAREPGPYREAPGFRLLCSAGLIGPDVLLTAKHCLPNLSSLADGERPFFALGPDIARPRRLVPIADWKETPTAGEGWNLIGSDVAVVFLEHAITEVKPLKLGNLKDEDIGAHFGVAGYGVRDEMGSTGIRRAGTVTLRAREGSPYHLIFESLKAFVETVLGFDYETMDGSDAGVRRGVGGLSGIPPGDDLSSEVFDPYRTQYDKTLWAGNEVYVGGGACDSQVCFGDSGSPLVRFENGELVAYGVASGTVISHGSICEHGLIYATFSAETTAMLDDAKRWINACGSVLSAGTCEGTRATRCARLGEGERRVLTTDCAAFGQTCAHDYRGEASCVSTHAMNGDGGIQGNNACPSGALSTGPLGGIGFSADGGPSACNVVTGGHQ